MFTDACGKAGDLHDEQHQLPDGEKLQWLYALFLSSCLTIRRGMVASLLNAITDPGNSIIRVLQAPCHKAVRPVLVFKLV